MIYELIALLALCIGVTCFFIGMYRIFKAFKELTRLDYEHYDFEA